MTSPRAVLWDRRPRHARRARPALAAIGQTFVPLMVQNERAFDRGRALYDGTLLGHPFRAVAKTFQVQVWRELRGAFGGLNTTDQARVAAWLGLAPDVFRPAA